MTNYRYGRNPEQVAAINVIRRLAGLDPDGPLTPMQPHKTEAQELNEMLEEHEKRMRDDYLILALKFT